MGQPDAVRSNLPGNKNTTRRKKWEISTLCELAHIARATYYKWLTHPISDNELENQHIAENASQVQIGNIKTANGKTHWQRKLYIFLIVRLTGSSSVLEIAK